MSSPGDKNLSRKIKDFALSIGFDLIGIAPSKQLDYHKEVINNWLSAGMNADMRFISRDIDKRTDPALLFNGAKSVVVAGINYYSAVKQGDKGMPIISKYAYGKDYHIVIGEKLNELLHFIISCEPAASGMVCVDSSPVLEKAWAHEAGLGWIGKNSILINNKKGSFIFLGEIILNIDLQYEKPFSDDFCGSCRLCLDACPTNAINKNRTIDAKKCISWLTVENKNPIPEEFKTKMNNRIFGCDICQDVCPWNRNAKPHNHPEFILSPELAKINREGWLSLSKEKYLELFSQSSVGRLKYERLKRNIEAVLKDKS
jgi:epoxyqueuosine reductase